MMRVLFLCTILHAAFGSECGNFFDDSDDNICYEVSANASNWMEARDICHSFGAEVVSIHNQQENNFIRRLAVSNGAVNGVYLGGALTGKGYNFAWIDGSDWDYANFRPGYPVKGNGECLVMDTTSTAGQWINMDCNSEMPVVCARDPDPCKNGGILSNGTCECTEFWSGNKCGVPLCQNNGLLSTDGKSCQCAPGYGGDVCQFVQCEFDSRATFSNDDKVLALIIEKTENTADSIRDIANNFQKLVDTINAKADRWITAFMLSTFSVSGTDDGVVLLRDVDDVVNHLNEYATEADSLMGNCQMPIWDVINDVNSIMSPFLNRAEVLIITAASPADSDNAKVQSTMEMFDEDSPIVDFIHIESVCQADDYEQGLEPFYSFIKNTGGIVFRVQPDKVAEALIEFVPTRYAAQSLTTQEANACTQNKMYIQVDSRMTEVYISVGGDAASVQVINPQGGQASTTPVFSTQNQKLWKFLPSYPGIYSVTISSDNRFCFPAVYGYGGAQVFVGFIQDYATGDKPLPYAVYGKVNFPVFHLADTQIDGLPSDVFGTLYIANMIVQTVGTNSTGVYDTDLDLRTGCSYEYIGRAFVCANKGDMITIIASGVDDFNQPFSRKTVSWCKE